MTVRTRVALACCLSLIPLSTRAAAPPTTPTTRIDPAARTAFGWLHDRHELPPWFADAARRPSDGRIALVVRTRDGKAPRATTHVQLEHDGAPLASGAFLLRADASGFARLENDVAITHLEIAVARRMVRPLDWSRHETGVETALRSLLTHDGTLLDGTGSLIVDIDSSIHVNHPALFRADAGTFAWVDIDRDGRFDPEKDGVDVQRDGNVATLRRLAFAARSLNGNTLEPDLDELRLERDFLYVDENGNHERDFGADFDEATPAYGEPLFVADDANGNGLLDVGEKLLRLGTSKIRALKDGRRLYTRGDSKNPLSRWNGLENDPYEALHATGVVGILAGGVWGTTRQLGLAPGAEVASYVSSAETIGGIQWAIDQKAQAVLTEYAPYTGFPLDGSTEEEQLLDAAVEHGVVAVSPAGNLNGGEKHIRVALDATPRPVVIKTDARFDGSPLIMLTVLDRGAAASVQLSIKTPGGSAITIGSSQTVLDDGLLAQAEWSRTQRGTNMLNVYVFNEQQTALPSGPYELALSTTAGSSLPIDAFVADYTTSWAYGATFENATNESTVCHPATADRTLGVAAYTLHAEREYGGSSPQGALASYSSRGPLLDGRTGIAIAAPDNPLAANIPLPDAPVGTHAVFAPFGGTSGAGPHVAAAVALLHQAFPTASADQLRTRLLDNARAVEGDANEWGRGKLDVERALGIVNTSELQRPGRVRVEGPADGIVAGRANELRVTTYDGLGEGARARWDLDYDGTPETGWDPSTTIVFTPTVTGSTVVRVWVANAAGYVVGAAVPLDVLGAPLQPAPADAGTPSNGRASDDGLDSLGGGSCAMATGTEGSGGYVALACAWLLGRTRRKRAR